MASFGAAVSAVHELGALVRAAAHLQLQGRARLVVLAAAPVLRAHPAVALQLHVRRARITWRWMTRPVTRMSTTLFPLRLTFLLTFLTVRARIDLIRRVLDFMAVPPARVVTAVELPSALPPTTPTLCHVARERCSLVGAQAGYGNWSTTGGARQLFYFYYRTPLFPGPRWFY